MPTPGQDSWLTISRHLDEALDMTGDQRAAWLASLSAREPGVAKEVAALLDEHAALANERFLEGQAAALPPRLPVGGDSIGQYRLVSPIGYGGMGTVWLAERSDGRFERRAAIKFLNIALVGRGEGRFRREGAILARLSHPHIAQLLDAGVTDDGRAYLVLEYVDGEPIDRYCDRVTLGVEARVRLMLDVMSAVANAHTHLVVHRDLKPSNVLVTRDGEVKLLDFGIARLLEQGQPGVTPTQLTRAGEAAFTPEYAAPEQVTGAPLTTAVDVYALGVLLYVLLAGRHPAGPSLESPAALLRAITDLEPPRPSEVVCGRRPTTIETATTAARRATTPERLRRTLRADLDTIVTKALKKQPGERYESVTAFADDLRRYLHDEPIAARPDTVRYRARKFVRRNRVPVTLAVVAFLAIIAGATGTAMQARTARLERDFALHQLARAEALNDLNDFIVSDAAPSGKPFTVNDLLARAEQIVGRQRGADAASRVDLLISLGRHYWGLDQDANSLRVLNEAYRQSRQLDDPSVRARAACALAPTLARNGNEQRADALIDEGLRISSRLPLTSDRANCLLRGSDVSREAGRATEAIARVQAAQTLLAASPFQSDIEKLGVLMDLAESYRLAARPREASAAFEQASTLLTVLGRDNTQRAGTLLNNWGMALWQLGRPLEADRLFRRAIAISSAGEGEQAVSPMLLANEARVLDELHRLPEAADYAERAYAGARRAGDNVVVNQSLLVRAAVYRMQGRFDAATAALTEVEPRLQRSLPPGHVAFASVTMQHALLEQAQGRVDAALEAADRAIAMTEAATRAGGQGALYLPGFLLFRADIERQLEQWEKCAADARHVLSLLRSAGAADTTSSLAGQAYLALGRALAAQGRTNESAPAFQSAVTCLEPALGRDHPDTLSARQLAHEGLPTR